MDSTLSNGTPDANQNVSEPVVQRDSFDQQKLEEMVNKMLAEKLADPRTTQSLKDKALSDMKKAKDFKDYFKEIQAMRESGMTDKEIEYEARIRAVEERESHIASNSPGKAVPANTTDTVKMFAQVLGLDLNDPEVVSSLSPNTEETLKGLKTISDRRKVAANPAVVAQPSGDSARQPDLAEYKARLANIKHGDVNALIDLKMEYRKRGLDIN